MVRDVPTGVELAEARLGWLRRCAAPAAAVATGVGGWVAWVTAETGAGVPRRPNNSFAGVFGSSGLASGGSGLGLSVPLSCAPAVVATPSSITTDNATTMRYC